MGERWQLPLRLKALHGTLNPHGFDVELWMWEQGLQASAQVHESPKNNAQTNAPQKIESTYQHPIETLRQLSKEKIDATVNDKRWAGLISALLMGDQNAIDAHDWPVFRATGVAHLMMYFRIVHHLVGVDGAMAHH